MSSLRSLPSVDHLLQTPQAQDWLIAYGRTLTTEAMRTTLDNIRRRYKKDARLPERDEILESIESILQTWTAPTLRAVINATGVILHTNLGRAPLSQASIQAMQLAASGYSTLEYDLAKGSRGSRSIHAEELLKRLSGAQAALVVNNNAAAVLLALSALARRRGVVIARSQLVEIGGGFRVPEVMQQSGARLVEIGTTNRVHLADYQAALEESPALVLRAHRSNFQILGFTSEPELAEIAAAAHKVSIPVVDDLGSGAFLDTARYGMGHEPMVQESLKAGSDLVCFSGDKLLGGPQAGVILGQEDLIKKLKKHPLARAVRADKLCLAALSATLLHYLKDEAEQQVPIWQMISTSVDQLQRRASAWAQALGQGEVVPGLSTVGGGSLPGETLPSMLLALTAGSPTALLSSLRQANPPVIARLENDRLLLDPRTVLPEQDSTVINILKQVLAS